ncbi:MAG: diguanylate cyclase [Aquabacterium sp.]
MDIRAFALHSLMYFVVPLWITMGLIDWFCHRRSHIAQTAGTRESMIHLLMFCELALPMIAALLLEINALIIGLMIVCYFIHEATALWDVSYAVSKREVSPIEQHVHSHLELVPMLALLSVVTLHHEQFLALFHAGDIPPDYRIMLKAQPLPATYLSCVFGGAFVFNVLPYLQELWAGIRAGRQSGPTPLAHGGPGSSRQGL